MKALLKKLIRFNYSAHYQDSLAFKYLKSCPKILDVGAGTGRFLKLNPTKITGLDPNPLTKNIIKGSATKLPFKASSFNGLHCAHVIEHLNPKEVYTALKEFSRVLKPNGILVIRSPLLWSGFYHNLTHFKPYPPKALTRYLVENAPDTTFPKLKTKYQPVALHYRYHKREKNGYTLVLKKLS